MAAPRCLNCVYCVIDPEVWLHAITFGEPICPQCANHPDLPGRLYDVSGVACCNYHRKPKLPTGESVRMIPLGDGFYAYVDAADYEWLSAYKWRQVNGYAARSHNGRWVFMHREIMHPPKRMVVDHIDSNRANNCRFNLRVCTHAENLRNARKRCHSRSRFKGIYYFKASGKWCARCWCKGRTYWLGCFDDEVDAARAYDRGAVEFFGGFARLNFPEEWPPERRAQLHADFVRTGESSCARKRVRSQRSQAGTTKAKKPKAAGKTKKVTGRTPDKKPRATRAGRRATKSKRATGHEPRPAATAKCANGRSYSRKKRKKAKKTDRKPLDGGFLRALRDLRGEEPIRSGPQARLV